MLFETKNFKIEKAIFASEKHADGSPHLHVYVSLETSFHSTLPSCLDIPGEDQGQDYHGNYQVARNPRNTIQYVIKSGDYVTIPEDWDPKGKGPSALTLVCGMIAERKSLQDIWQAHPSSALIHKRKIDEMLAEVTKWEQVRSLVSIAPLLWGPVPMELSQNVIWDWLQTNVLHKRVPRQPQLFIHGEPGIGKTHLVGVLRQALRVYDVPVEDFYDMYRDEDFDLAIMDEFKGWKTIQWMNSWLQGTVMCLRKKGAQYLKTKNLPTIVIANVPLEDIYRNTAAVFLEALRQRLIIVNTTHETLDPVIAAMENFIKHQ